MPMIPTVHLNGTSKDALLNDNMAAMRAVSHAMEILAKASPHGRDFYPQGDGAIRRAGDEHVARMTKLEAVRAELEEICLAIRGG